MAFGIGGLLFCPIIFSGVGILCGIIAAGRGDPHGKTAAIVSGATLAVAIIGGVIVGILAMQQ